MSITKETLEQHLKDPAIFCCRRQKGLVIGAADLEDPSLFDDMVESGLLTLSPEGLRIGQVLGSTLLTDVEALTPITRDVLDKVNESAETPATEKKESAEVCAPVIKTSAGGNGMIHIEIGKAEKLEKLVIDIPQFAGSPAPAEESVPAGEKRVIRTLLKKHIKITDVEIGKETSIKDGKITIDGSIVEKAVLEDPLCKSMKLDVIRPENRHVYTETIMDVCPIATKVEGELGSGVTKVADGVVFMLTGVDEDGVQVHEFGSSEGYLDEKMYFGHPGCADENDIIIRCHVVIQRLSGMTRPGPFAAHKCQDYVIQAVRDELKKYEGEVVREEICEDVRRRGNPRIVLVKEIMGQGAMHDNVICPNEPCGIQGGQKNVDCGNVPIILTPNQVRDGSIHALTCIGPATTSANRWWRALRPTRSWTLWVWCSWALPRSTTRSSGYPSVWAPCWSLWISTAASSPLRDSATTISTLSSISARPVSGASPWWACPSAPIRASWWWAASTLTPWWRKIWTWAALKTTWPAAPA